MTCECCGRDDIALPRCGPCQREHGFYDDDKPDDEEPGIGMLLEELLG